MYSVRYEVPKEWPFLCGYLRMCREIFLRGIRSYKENSLTDEVNVVRTYAVELKNKTVKHLTVLITIRLIRSACA